MVLVGGKGKYYLFARDLFLFCLETMTTLDPDKAEFAFVQYCGLTSSLNNADAVLKWVCSWCATYDVIDLSFNYGPFSSETIEVGEWNGLESFFFNFLSLQSALKLLRTSLFFTATVARASLLREAIISGCPIGIYR